MENENELKMELKAILIGILSILSMLIGLFFIIIVCILGAKFAIWLWNII